MELEALERALVELEALDAIYGYEVDRFQLSSHGALVAAQSAVASGALEHEAPLLEMAITVDLDTQPPVQAVLRVGMPAGYPSITAATVVAEVPLVRRTEVQQLSAELTAHAQSLVGEESIMELVQLLQQRAATMVTAHQQAAKSSAEAAKPEAEASRFGRRWLWMNHIKAVKRRTQMMAEACKYSVGGLIKPGYPGICVIEGQDTACDEYTSWLKGIWIGRVVLRGEYNVDCGAKQVDELRQLPVQLEDLGQGEKLPNMGVLGTACKEAGLGEEFMDYVMQHRTNETE